MGRMVGEGERNRKEKEAGKERGQGDKFVQVNFQHVV